MSDEPKRSLYPNVVKLRKAAKAYLLKPGEEDMAAVLDLAADLCIAAERGDMEGVKRIAFGKEDGDD